MIPVSLDPDEIAEQAENDKPDRRVCVCGHLVRLHATEFGMCGLTSRGHIPRCACSNVRSIGTTDTPGKWNIGSPDCITERVRRTRPDPDAHPVELSLQRGAHLEWEPGEPRCDRCGQVATDSVKFRVWSDGQTRVWCGCQG